MNAPVQTSGLIAIPTASIVIPTRARPRYLEVALASIAPQAAAAGAEVLVVDDAGASPAVGAIAARFGARYEAHPRPLGLNVARNTGVARSRGPLVVFVDDDVEVGPGWLDALLHAARRHPAAQVLTGPIRPRLEGRGGWARRSCGREGPPITALDLGPADTDRVRYAWGANMAIRRSALERVGPFDVTLRHGGDEQEWQDRLLAEPRSDELQRGHGNSPRGNPTGQHDPTGSHHDPTSDPHNPTGQHDPMGSRGDNPGDGATGASGDGRVLYVAAAALDHRRSADDARLRALARGAYTRGRAARRFDARRGKAGRGPVPSLARELRTLAGCAGHVVRRRCPAGLTMVAHSLGRLQQGLGERRQAVAPADLAPPLAGGETASRGGSEIGGEDFLSGESGTVGGLDAVRRELRDQRLDARQLLSGQRLRLDRAARRRPPRRRVLVLGIQRLRHRDLAAAIQAELLRSRHDVELRFCTPGELGKFENLNRLLAAAPPRSARPGAGRDPCAEHDRGRIAQAGPDSLPDHDWLLVIDDDVVLPRGFLDHLLFLAERFALDIVQPAQRARSHAAWRVTRRQAGAVARETPFVEIGPVTAFAHRTFPALLPFPDLRMGWGLDLHWAALAREHGWRCGVLDAVPVRHSAAPAADAYPRAAAIAEARAFLAERPYLSAREAQLTLRTHRRW